MKTSILNKFNGALETIRKNSDIYSEILNNSTNLKLYELSRLEDLEESSFNIFIISPLWYKIYSWNLSAYLLASF